jgi:xylulokinase
MAAARSTWTHNAADRVAAVAVAAMVPSLAAVNRRGVPQTPGLLYGDARGRSVDPQARAGTGGEAIGFLSWTAAQAPAVLGGRPVQQTVDWAPSLGLAVSLSSCSRKKSSGERQRISPWPVFR